MYNLCMKKYILILFIFSLGLIISLGILSAPNIVQAQVVIDYNHKPGPFPGPGIYQTLVKGLNTTVNYNYSPPVPEVTVDMYSDFRRGQNLGLRLYMGQYHQSVYFGIASYADPLGDGRFDIRDPMNPKVDFVAVGGGLDRKGILSDLNWGHNGMNRNEVSSVAESPAGEARLTFAYSTGRSPWVVLGWEAGGKGYFGQQIDPNQLFTFPPTLTTQVISYTSAGNYFLYFLGEKSIPIFDLTVLSGEACEERNKNYPGDNSSVLADDCSMFDFLKPLSSIGWRGVTDLQIVRDPATNKNFMIARSNGATTSRPIVRIAEQNPETGKPLVLKNVSLTISQVSHPPVDDANYSYFPGSTIPNIEGFTNLKTFTLKNKIYVLATEDYVGDKDNIGCENYGKDTSQCKEDWLYNTEQGTAVLGLYEFNPTAFSLNKVSTIKIKDVTIAAGSVYEVSSSLDGSVYPIIIVPRQTRTGTSNYRRVFGNTRLAFYSLKPAFTAATLELLNPDFTVLDQQKYPIKLGDLVQNLWPYQSFLKQENGKVNMYFYRPAYRYVGGRTYPDAPYQVAVGGDIGDMSILSPLTNFSTRGDASLRVDRFDVTSLSSDASPSAIPGCGVGNAFSSVLPNTPCPPSSCTLGSQRLQVGSRGEDVRQLQALLGITTDGSFGPLTKQAVQEFQTTNNLTADGIVGPITRAAATIYCTNVKVYSATSPTVPSGPNLSPVIGAVSGPNSLNINEEGTWNVTATDANNNDLSWSVDWGEGRSVETCQVNPPIGTGQNRNYTASHAWTSAGTYTVTMFVNDCKGGTANKSFTVNVSGGGGQSPISPVIQIY